MSGRTPGDLQRAYAERFGTDPRDAPVAEDAADAAALLGVLGRSICREFKPDAVPEPLLRLLLACAQSAPTKSDLQQYSIVVVEEAAARAEIAAWLPNMPWVAEAPVFLVFCADTHRNRRICQLYERAHDNDNLDTFLNIAVDAALAMGSFIHAAEAAGLGCCPISYVRNHLPEARQLLSLPPGVFPIAGLCVGYPRRRMPVSMRLPQQVVVHRDRYDDGRLEAELAAYGERRHAAAPVPADKQRNAKVYGTTEVCTWPDQVSRQLSLPERAGFRAFLLEHGFRLE